MIDYLLSDTCTIKNRSTTAGRIVTETWNAQSSTTKCRVLKRSFTAQDVDKTKNATMIRTIFVLPKGANVSIRDRINYESRDYEVIEVITTMGAKTTHHKNAVCEVVV